MNQHFALIKLDFWEENVFVFIIAFKVHIVMFFLNVFKINWFLFKMAYNQPLSLSSECKETLLFISKRSMYCVKEIPT